MKVQSVAALIVGLGVGAVVFGPGIGAETKTKLPNACVAAIRASDDVLIETDAIFGDPNDDKLKAEDALYPQLLGAIDAGGGEFEGGQIQAHVEKLWDAEADFYDRLVQCHQKAKF